MSAINLVDDNESEIAITAGRVLRERFIEVSQCETVMYVENDAVVSKAPNSTPVVIKRLSGRNLELEQRVAARGTYKIKKRQFDDD